MAAKSLLVAAGEEDVPSHEAPPPLPSLQQLAARRGPEYDAALRTWRGPTPRSNWIWPGKILAGDRASLRDHLAEVVAAGITTFVSLQTKGESQPYQDGVTKLNASAKFVSLPIPDQKTTDDTQVAALVLALLRRVAAGESVYIHCKGGHGRTGTVCSLLLGVMYDLNPADALNTYQALHDLRQQPCFAADGYAATEDGASCVALFPVQREQVRRLLHRSEALEPPAPLRNLSDAYGRGASNYSEATLEEWQARGVSASEAVKRRDWPAACEEFEACVALRPDWQKGVACLEKARAKASSERDACAAAPSAEAAEHGAADGDTPAASASDTADPTAAAAPTATSTSSSPSALQLPSLVLLCGLPGAGKSTFAKALAQSNSSQWTVVDSDEVGGRRATEEAVCNACRTLSTSHGGGRGSVIVDRCHVKASDRAALLSLAGPLLPARAGPNRARGNGRAQGSTASDIVCVYFAAEAAQCIERVAARTDHPSIPYGHGRHAVESMAKALEVPPAVATAAQGGGGGGVVEAEGMRWIVVRGSSEVDQLLVQWGARAVAPLPPLGFFKFPRTTHVLNTGGTAVTRDDLVMSAAEAARFFDGRTVVVADEKVDGANLGISLTKEYEVRVQNRSHHVNAKTHAQFGPLGGWIDEHGWAICQLLEPEVEILFGEWCVAQHSVRYTKLPGYFIAFDIYNKRTGRFASATERARRLQGLGIPVVRTLARRVFHSRDDLLTLLEMQSAYADGFVEGAYLRIDSDNSDAAGDGDGASGGVNSLRGKIVRPDFIQGIQEHWQSAEIVRNVVRPDLWLEDEEEHVGVS